MGTLTPTDDSGVERKWGGVKDLEPNGGSFPSSGNTTATPAVWWESGLHAWPAVVLSRGRCDLMLPRAEWGGSGDTGRWVGGQQTREVLWMQSSAQEKVIREGSCMEMGKARASFRRPKAGKTLFTHIKWKWNWKLLGRIQLFASPWTVWCVEFSRPVHWSG